MKNSGRFADLGEKIQWYISLFVRGAIGIIFITSLYEGKIFLGFASATVLLASFLPAMIMRRVRLILPNEIGFFFLLFLFASLILGEMRDYYARFLWWDIMLHFLSAMMIGIIGFMIIYSLYVTHKVFFAPVFAAIFTFSFSLGLGAFWEIVEFTLDSSLGFHMQQLSLGDTMWDIIVDALGSLLVSLIGYAYLRGGSSLLMDRLVKRFVQMNKERFETQER